MDRNGNSKESSSCSCNAYRYYCLTPEEEEIVFNVMSRGEEELSRNAFDCDLLHDEDSQSSSRMTEIDAQLQCFSAHLGSQSGTISNSAGNEFKSTKSRRKLAYMVLCCRAAMILGLPIGHSYSCSMCNCFENYSGWQAHCLKRDPEVVIAAHMVP